MKKSILKNRGKINSSMKDLTDRYFKCTDRERAAFEAGIKLGTIFHQFIGTPISSTNVGNLEHTIEESVRVQPFVEDVKIDINRNSINNKKHQFDYLTLNGEMLEVKLIVKFNDSIVNANMKYIKEINYPLMFFK